MADEPEICVGPDGFGDAIGLEYVEHGDGLVRARAPVTDTIRQQYGIVHGGAYSAIAESICSAATAVSVMADGRIAIGQSNSATFLRPVTGGHINATARRRHGGRTTWVWDVDFTDDDDRLCALVRMTVAVREAPDGPGPSPGTGS